MGDALKRVVSRAISDAAFRRALQTNAKAALSEFDLSAAEIAALTSGDPSKLTALGIDQRMSRMFSVPVDGSAFSRFDAGDAAFANARIDDAAGAGGTPEAESVDVGTAGGGMPELERLAGDPASSSGVWSTDDPYGTDRLDRIDGSTGGADLEAHDGEGGQLPTGGADHTTE